MLDATYEFPAPARVRGVPRKRQTTVGFRQDVTSDSGMICHIVQTRQRASTLPLGNRKQCTDEYSCACIVRCASSRLLNASIDSSLLVVEYSQPTIATHWEEKQPSSRDTRVHGASARFCANATTHGSSSAAIRFQRVGRGCCDEMSADAHGDTWES